MATPSPLPRPPRPRRGPLSWHDARQQDVAQLERRTSLLGRSHVGAVAATITLVGISVLLTALLFASISHLGGQEAAAAPRVTAVQQGQEGLQVVHADPLDRSSVIAHLSVPGRLAVNGPAAEGPLLAGHGVALGSGSILAGDTLRVCTLAPAPAVELTLLDAASGRTLASHTFADAPLCVQAG